MEKKSERRVYVRLVGDWWETGGRLVETRGKSERKMNLIDVRKR